MDNTNAPGFCPDNMPVFGRPVPIKAASVMSALTLAFIGDAVETLFIRTDVALNTDFKTGELHKRTSKTVNAGAQSELSELILPLLNDDELWIYKRARNGKSKNSAKNAGASEYKKATALEAVIGFLYITGQNDRLRELLSHRLPPR